MRATAYHTVGCKSFSTIVLLPTMHMTVILMDWPRSRYSLAGQCHSSTQQRSPGFLVDASQADFFSRWFHLYTRAFLFISRLSPHFSDFALAVSLLMADYGVRVSVARRRYYYVDGRDCSAALSHEDGFQPRRLASSRFRQYFANFGRSSFLRPFSPLDWLQMYKFLSPYRFRYSKIGV